MSDVIYLIYSELSTVQIHLFEKIKILKVTTIFITTLIGKYQSYIDIYQIELLKELTIF